MELTNEMIKNIDELHKAIHKAVAITGNEVLLTGKDIVFENYNSAYNEIVFPNKKQSLSYDDNNKLYTVGNSVENKFVSELPLKKVEPEDREVGKIYLAFNGSNPKNVINEIEHYIIYLGNDEFVSVTKNNETRPEKGVWTHWYEVCF